MWHWAVSPAILWLRSLEGSDDKEENIRIISAHEANELASD